MEIKHLLNKGYFPEEVTPPFTTEDLSRVVELVLANIDTYDPLDRRQRMVISKTAAFSIPKNKGYRRNLGIPNPLHYIRLSNTIVEHWRDIILHCSQSEISLSRLNLRDSSLRSILKPSFKDITKERIIRSTGNRYVLKIDIAKFYSSIYTHSIPWALHTKAVSKRNRNRSYFGNAIDEDCRKMQDGQTIGLPIGPDTSRVISEIILSSIDNMIKHQLGYIEGLRVVDDYHLYFKNLSDLEKGRVIVHKTLKEYELELNQNKEKIFELPEIIENEWFSIIREFKFRNKPSFQRTDLITYFDTIMSYSKKFPEDMVFTFALSKLRFTVFNKRNWLIFQSLLLNALLVEPKVIPYVAQNLISYQKKRFTLSQSVIRKSMEQFIIYHCNLDNDFEIIWALWLVKSLNLNLSKEVAAVLSSSKNSLVILTTLDLRECGLLSEGLDTTFWSTMLTKDNLYSEYWLVAYEVKKNQWISNDQDYLNQDPFFKILYENNISFYKPGRELDLSKVKVTTDTEYIGDDEEYVSIKESDSVFATAKPFVAPKIHKMNQEYDDLPF